MRKLAPVAVFLVLSGCAAMSPTEKQTLDYVAVSGAITASANTTSALLNAGTTTPQQAMMLWSSLSAAQRLLNQSATEAEAGKTELALTLFNMALEAAGQVELVLANVQAQKELADGKVQSEEAGKDGSPPGPEGP